MEEAVKQFQTLDGNVAVVFTERFYINAKSECQYVEAHTRFNTISSPFNRGHDVPITNGALVRKTAFHAVHGFDEQFRIFEDCDLSIRLTEHYQNAHIPKPLYAYRRAYGSHGRASACGSIPSQIALTSRRYFLEKHTPPELMAELLRPAWKREWAAAYSDTGKYHLSQGQRKKAREFLRQSLMLSPFSRRTWLRYLRSFVPF